MKMKGKENYKRQFSNKFDVEEEHRTIVVAPTQSN
jgi:hypothetical protein